MRTEVELRPCPMRSHVPGLSSPADDITTNYPLLSLMCLILSLQIEIQMSRHPLMISQHHTPFSLIRLILCFQMERKKIRSFLQKQIKSSLHSDVKYTQLMMIDNDLKLSKMI